MSPAVTAIRSGAAWAQLRRNASIRIWLSLSSRSCEIRTSRCGRWNRDIRHDVGIGQGDTKRLFEEGHQLQNARRIDKIAVDQRKFIGQRISSVAEQEVLHDES